MEEEITPRPIDQNDRIMAAMAHITVLLPLMGVIAPIIIWATQRDKSEFVAFQALQAAIYQLSLIVLYFLGMVCYACSFLVLIPISISGSDSGILYTGEWLGVFIPFVIFGLVIVGGIAYVIYGVVAAILVLQGKDFRYILIGRWLEGYLSKK